jgi:tRNA A37 threonylcarbamoyltransferase TsaD
VAADAAADGRRCFLPSRAMCTDNAAMVAAAGWWRWRSDGPTSLAAAADPNLRLAFEQVEQVEHVGQLEQVEEATAALPQPAGGGGRA